MHKLDGHTLTIEQLWQGSTQNLKFALSDKAAASVDASRAFVEELAQQDRAIYGINTGFGPLSGTRISDEDIKQHQLNLLHHLSVGQKPLFDEQHARAIMISRSNALARGFSGIRKETLELLVGCINNNIVPEIPTFGSVGASGDLVPLAHMARPLVGLGHVSYENERVTAIDAFERAGLNTVELACKEGLALVNGTSAMTGIMALATRRAGKLLDWMEFLSACMFQVLYGAPEVLCDRLHKARSQRGQVAVAHRLTEHMLTHPDYMKMIRDHEWGTNSKSVEAGIEIQDAYSLRCVPQILGAFQDALWHIEKIVTRELNATTDNPLIFADTEVVIHGGNFYGQHISMVSDYLKNGLIKLAILSDRQLERLVNWRYSQGLSPLLVGGMPGINTGMGGCQLLATSLVAEAKGLSIPGSIQSIPTNANNQDVVSMGFTAAKQASAVVEILWKLVGIQSLALVQAADLRDDKNMMGESYKKFHDLIRSVSPQLKDDRPLFEDIAEVTALIQREDVHDQFFSDRPTES
jgi:histidine ammonia-lyase